MDDEKKLNRLTTQMKRKKFKQPSEEELAKCAGMSLASWNQIKTLTLDDMVAVAGLFGCEMAIRLSPQPKRKILIKGRQKKDKP